MTAMGSGYMPLDRQLFGRSMAEALASLLGQKYRSAKDLAIGVGIDISTAENLRKGHLSVTTLQKVLAKEGRALANRLLDELYGETFYAFEERRIAAVIREAEDANANLVRLRSLGEDVLSSAPRLDEAGAGALADEGRLRAVGAGHKAGQRSNGGAEGSRDHQELDDQHTKPRKTGG